MCAVCPCACVRSGVLYGRYTGLFVLYVYNGITTQRAYNCKGASFKKSMSSSSAPAAAAAAQAPKRLKEDLGAHAPPTSSAAAAAGAGSVAHPIDLADEDEDEQGLPTLSKYIWLQGGAGVTNPAYKCLVEGCGRTGHSKVRAMDHLRKHTGSEIKALVKQHDEAREARTASKATSASAAAARQANTKQGDMLKHKLATNKLNEGLAAYAIDSMSPFIVVEHPEFLQLIDEVLAVGRSSPLVSAKDVVGRTSFTKVIKAAAGKRWDMLLEKLLVVAELGATISLDGRSNIAQDAMLFFALHTNESSVLLGGFNAGANKKSSEYIANLLRVLAGAEVMGFPSELIDPRLSRCVFASIQDNAFAVQAGGLVVEEDDAISLVRLNCVLHGVALYMAWLSRRIALVQEIFDRMETLTGFFRKRPRAKALLKELATERKVGPVALLRLVPTRMMLHVLSVARALKLRHVLDELIGGAGMRQYKDQLDAEGLSAFQRTKVIIKDAEFWSNCEFFVAACTPAYKMLRFMDGDDARAYDVRPILSRGADSLAIALGKDEFKDIPAKIKVEFVETWQDLWERIECPGHVAAFMLDPANHAPLTAKAISSNVDDKAEFLQDLTHAKAVVRVVCKRLRVVDKKLVCAIESSSAARTLEQVAELELSQYFYSPAHTKIDFGLVDVLDKAGFWKAAPLPCLSVIGRILMTFPASTGALERGLKINAGIHVSSRVSLKDASVDMLTKGYVAGKLKLKPVDLMSREAWYKDFDRVTDADEKAAESYLEAVAGLQDKTEASIRQQRSTTADGPGGADLDEADTGQVAQQVEGEQTGQLELNPAEDLPAATATGRQRRDKRLTGKLRAALEALKDV